MAEYLLPDVGEGLTEAEIVSWKVKVGDTVAINDIVCEIETAKSIVELPSPNEVTFHARIFEKGRDVSFTERSQFVKENGEWKYVSGDLSSE
jgi:pyruvate dehydrogenase E2 component (dihydrolipoamide acetyltransferase)